MFISRSAWKPKELKRPFVTQLYEVKCHTPTSAKQKYQRNKI